MGGRGSNSLRNSSTGVPESMPTLEAVMTAAKALKGEALENAITQLEWDGDWYREDKRQKKAFVEGVVKNNYVRDPAESGSGVTDQIDINKKILRAVYNLPMVGKEVNERFGRYDVDVLYRRRNK